MKINYNEKEGKYYPKFSDAELKRIRIFRLARDYQKSTKSDCVWDVYRDRQGRIRSLVLIRYGFSFHQKIFYRFWLQQRGK